MEEFFVSVENLTKDKLICSNVKFATNGIITNALDLLAQNKTLKALFSIAWNAWNLNQQSKNEIYWKNVLISSVRTLYFSIIARPLPLYNQNSPEKHRWRNLLSNFLTEKIRIMFESKSLQKIQIKNSSKSFQ